MQKKEIAPAQAKANNILHNSDSNQKITQMPAENKTQVPNLLTLQQFVAKYSAFTKGGMRAYIFYEGINGLKEIGAIKRVGRKMLIDVDKFFQWVDGNPSTKGDIHV